MDQNIFNFTNQKIISNNNNLLLELLNELLNIKKNSKDKILIKVLGNITNKLNKIICENKKNFEAIINGIYQINKKLDKNEDPGKELKYKNGKYKGQVLKGKMEGKGTFNYSDGERYEGDFRNDKKEGKGIYYFNNGNRMMGDYYNGKPIGKHVMLTENGDVEIENY